jgi:hypothetical protein
MIIIITAYRVSQQSKNFRNKANTDMTAHHQQLQLLTEQGFLDPNPRNQCLIDLPALIQFQCSLGHEIILMLDIGYQ